MIHNSSQVYCWNITITVEHILNIFKNNVTRHDDEQYNQLTGLFIVLSHSSCQVTLSKLTETSPLDIASKTQHEISIGWKRTCARKNNGLSCYVHVQKMTGSESRQCHRQRWEGIHSRRNHRCRSPSRHTIRLLLRWSGPHMQAVAEEVHHRWCVHDEVLQCW